MDDNSMNMGAGWIWVFLIIAVLFGGNFGFGAGNNVAAMTGIATQQDVQNGFANLNTQNVLLSSANNNYETARLINSQTTDLMSQMNTALVNSIQGFNAISAQIANQTNVLGSKLDNLGFQMENCCCSIKTLIKDNQIADLTNQLNQANNVAVNTAQSQYLLSQMGHWVANSTSGTT